MALQASGPISFSQISNEFGLPPSRNLGAYRISQTIGNLNRPLDDGIPQSGTIRFGNFYSKRLNMVVYCSGNRVTARSRYNDNNNVFVIGGYKTRPASSSGTKVWIHTNETISSNIPAISAPNRQYCSLITGGWEGGTDLRLDIGTSGVVSGAGGNGGSGATDRRGPGPAGAGRFGTSAIGVNYQPITITNRGRIQGGTGGGGGGGAAYSFQRDRQRRTYHSCAGGGGGGGGLGSPGGSGGPRGGEGQQGRSSVIRFSSAGGSGNINNGGGGGVDGIAQGSRTYASGGAGGGGSGSRGGGGSGGSATARGSVTGGAGDGADGFGIIITNNGAGVTISGNARIGGDAYNTGVA